MAVETATVGCMSSETSRGLKIIPPPTPKRDESSPPKKEIVVTSMIFVECHWMSPSTKLYDDVTLDLYSASAYHELRKIRQAQMPAKMMKIAQ